MVYISARTIEFGGAEGPKVTMLGEDETPVVYLVDDDPGQIAAERELRERGVDASWVHPLDLEPWHLKRATLLAVDEYFDLREPTETVSGKPLPADLPVATVPADGLALAAVLRSVGKEIRSLGRPLGITLRTGQLDELTQGIPQGVREPLVASQHDLEWVLAKSATVLDPFDQIVALAEALHAYPKAWPSGSVRDVGLRWLSVPNQPWLQLAQKQVMQCRPPVEATATSQHGLAWFRWLTRQILPYPTFLLSLQRTAVLMGVSASSLAEAIEAESPVGRELANVGYTGPLAGLYKQRFWRAGIIHLIKQKVEEDEADDPIVVGDRLARLDPQLESLGMMDPVICIDRDYRESSAPFERSEAERLVPDGWPAYADAAWGTKEEVEDGDLADLILPRGF